MLRFLIFGLFVIVSVLQSAYAEGDATSPQDTFALHARCLTSGALPKRVTSNVQYLGGPIPLEVSLVYLGEAAVSLRASLFQSLTIVAPEGWIPRKDWEFQSSSTRSEIVLQPKQTVSEIVYLQELFELIPVGKTDLIVRVQVDTQFGGRIPRETAVPITVREIDQGAQRQMLAKTLERIKGAKVWHIEGIARGVSMIDNQQVIPILAESLRDSVLYASRLHELCRKYNDWEALVDYLAKHGKYRDFIHFAYWRKNAIALSDVSIARLLTCNRNWTKLYAYSSFGKDYLRRNPDHFVSFLQFDYELRTMTDEVTKLKKEFKAELKFEDVDEDTLRLLMYD